MIDDRRDDQQLLTFTSLKGSLEGEGQIGPHLEVLALRWIDFPRWENPFEKLKMHMPSLAHMRQNQLLRWAFGQEPPESAPCNRWRVGLSAAAVMSGLGVRGRSQHRPCHGTIEKNKTAQDRRASAR